MSDTPRTDAAWIEACERGGDNADPTVLRECSEQLECKLAEARKALQVAHTWIAGRTREFAGAHFTDRYGYAESGKKVLDAIDAARREHG